MEALSSLASTIIGKVMMWVIGILVVIIIGMLGWVYLLKADVKIAESSLLTAQADTKLNEIQKDTLRQAINDQSDAVEKQKIDAEKRAAKFEIASKSIWTKYEATKAEVKSLSGDAECQAIRKIIGEAVE